MNAPTLETVSPPGREWWHAEANSLPPLRTIQRHDEELDHGLLDPRLVFLARASARLLLVDAGDLSLNEAMIGLAPDLGPMFEDMVELFAQQNRTTRAARHQAYRSTPATVIEAIMVCVRERGPAALREPKNVDRLRRCDGRAKQEINARVAKLRGAA